MSAFIPMLLPNRQNKVNRDFAYLALEHVCHVGKDCLMDTKPNRIKELREARDMTVEAAAEASGLSTSYFSRLENGGRNLSVKNMNLIAGALGVQPKELLPLVEPGDGWHPIAIVGRIGAGAEILPEEEQVPPEGLFEIEVPFPIPDDALAFEVVGESMWPRYDPGDIVICFRQSTNVEDVLGWEAAVKTESGSRFLKRVLRGDRSGLFNLESHNAAPIRNQRIVWVAAIQAVVRTGQWRKLTEAGRARLIKRMIAAE